MVQTPSNVCESFQLRIILRMSSSVAELAKLVRIQSEQIVTQTKKAKKNNGI